MARANLTLQDRLAKELRLRGINDMEAANAYLPECVVAQAARPSWKPAPDHPWRRAFKPSEQDAA